MIAYLKAHRDGATWLVAVQGSSAAASIILQTGGLPVMAMGGFRGSDPAPTLTQIEQYVKQGKLHYVLAGGRAGFAGAGFGGGGFAAARRGRHVGSGVGRAELHRGARICLQHDGEHRCRDRPDHRRALPLRIGTQVRAIGAIDLAGAPRDPFGPDN